MSETITRIVSGIIIAIVYVTFFQTGWFTYVPLVLFICLVSVIVLGEFYRLFLTSPLDRVNIIIGKLAGILIVLGFYLESLQSFELQNEIKPELLQNLLSFFKIDQTIVLFSLIILIIMLGMFNILTARLQGGLMSMSIVIFGLLYIPFTISFIILLRGMEYGTFYIWFVSLVTVMTDVGGYFTGKFLGKHKLNLPVSPNKTWEGYIGAFILQAAASFLFFKVTSGIFDIPKWSIPKLIILSFLIFITSVFGDLFESLVKRNASAKDSGHFLPGHGGLLDRIDSIMFSLPVFYLFITLSR